ncbi:tetratricopeptide repeat protein [bacterium]|nr:tetratricopeptide repeat protein [bacterium]
MKQLTKTMLAVPVVLLVAGLLAVTGCSSSGQAVYEEEPAGDVEDIDALLGLTNDTSDKTENAGNEEKKTQDTIAEDDVLKLLGVTENKTVAEQKPVTEKPKTTVRKNETAVDTRVDNAATEQTRTAAEQNRAAEETVPPAATYPAYNRGTFQDRYQAALSKAREERDYRTAIQMFEELLSENMTHSLSDNCQYWIGECYDSLGDYQQAAVAFEKVFTFYNSNKEADAQLKLGICYMRMKNLERARLELQKFIDNYPSHPKVSLARQYLNQIAQ